MVDDYGLCYPGACAQRITWTQEFENSLDKDSKTPSRKRKKKKKKLWGAELNGEEHLLNRNPYLSANLQHLGTKLEMCPHTCNPRAALEQRREAYWGLLAASLVAGSVRDCVYQLPFCCCDERP